MLVRLTAALRERQYLGAGGLDEIVNDDGGGEHATIVLDQNNCLVGVAVPFCFGWEADLYRLGDALRWLWFLPL